LNKRANYIEEVARLILLNINVDSIVSIIFIIILLIFYSIKGGEIDEVAGLRSYYTIRNVIEALNGAEDIVDGAEEMVDGTEGMLDGAEENA
jgi:hypothetical protein